MRVLLVEDGYRRGSLAAARGLGRAGIAVGVASPSRGLATESRYVDRHHPIRPLPLGYEAFIADVSRAIREGGYDLVFPAGDAEVLALSHGRSELGAFLPYPDHGSVVRILDKVALGEAAMAVGLAAPAVMEPDGDLSAMPPPYVVKARTHWVVGPDEAPPRWETEVVRTPQEARRRADVIRAEGGEPFVQQHVSGDLIALSVLVGRSGRAVAAVQSSGGELTWPSGAGVRVRAETVAVDEDLVERVAALLHRLGWWGLADLDFLQPQGGAPHLIDTNGRFYGSMAIALNAGVNFPALWCGIADDEARVDTVRGRAGARYHWLEGDLRRALFERRGGVVADVLSCLRWAPTAAHSTFSYDDPKPFVWHVSALGRRIVRKTLDAGQPGR